MTTDTIQQKTEPRPSPIHGTGVFATEPIARGDHKIHLHINAVYNQEPFKFLNHSDSPNCIVTFDDSSTCVRVLRDIDADEELTINYGPAVTW